MAGTAPIICSSRRWGGRRIQRPDVGGLWSSDEARGKDTSGVLAQVDGWPAPARRALPVRAAVSCPPRADGSNVIGGDPVRPEARAASRRARGKRLRGAGLLRRNGNNTTAPGEARPPRALPDPPRKQAEKSHAPKASPSPGGGGWSRSDRVGRTQHTIHRHAPRRLPPTRLRLRLSHPPSAREGEAQDPRSLKI